MLVLGEFAPPKPFLPVKFIFLKVTHVVFLLKKLYCVYMYLHPTLQKRHL